MFCLHWDGGGEGSNSVQIGRIEAMNMEIGGDEKHTSAMTWV
jgi:hypothetical protein